MSEDLNGVLSARDVLDLQQIGERRFRSVRNQDNGMHAIFGGQPLAQALAAAQRTAPPWPAHSCTGYFLRGGVVAEPIDYEVEVLRDGRRYATRRVLATQGGKAIFDMLCSFHDAEPGPWHQTDDAGDAPAPETLMSMGETLKANAAAQLTQNMVDIHVHFPIDLRLVNPEVAAMDRPSEPRRSYWLRMPSAEGIESVHDHQCLLAFLSDYWFPSAAGAPHQSPERRVAPASLNHTLWFHTPVRADEWLLWRTDSPWAGEGRGVTRGLIYNRAGKLVASAVQELSMRWF
jgi:acyl-CoA thioesterase-2